jgi:hypothetical protein
MEKISYPPVFSIRYAVGKWETEMLHFYAYATSRKVMDSIPDEVIRFFN